MRPFLFLGTRAEDAAADGEYQAVLRFAGLSAAEVHRVRLEQDHLGTLDLAEWSGVILGGGPFNLSDPPEAKSPVQRRVEAELHDLAHDVIAADFPFLGACYGIGTLGGLHGGLVDRTYGEPISAPEITLTPAARDDQLLSVLPDTFHAFVGHKEAVRVLPQGAVLLASSPTCPVQAFRIGTNVYATQFHPELDAEGLCVRIDVYRDHGYFEPWEVDTLKAMGRAAVVTAPQRILRRFVELFARS